MKIEKITPSLIDINEFQDVFHSFENSIQIKIYFYNGEYFYFENQSHLGSELGYELSSAMISQTFQQKQAIQKFNTFYGTIQFQEAVLIKATLDTQN